jgi:hypothetical protein
MLLIGGPVKGRKVYGKWPGLGADQRFEGRDLAVTTDFPRRVRRGRRRGTCRSRRMLSRACSPVHGEFTVWGDPR